MKSLFSLTAIPLLAALFASGCATSNPAANALGNWAGSMMIAEAGRPQVTVNNVTQQPGQPVTEQYVTDKQMDDGVIYTGLLKLKDGRMRPQGTGKLRFSDGREYSGDFEYGGCHGQGRLTAVDGRRWEGEWKAGHLVKGLFTAPTGERYEGEWKGFKTHGYGRFTKPAGDDYSGEFRDGEAYKVKGTQYYADGTKQVGEWNKDGSKSGGTITWKDGREYKGDWKVVHGIVDPPDGEGTMAWPDGKKYEGEWKDGKTHGFGKMTFADGKVQEGIWRNDKFVSAQTTPPASPTAISGKQGSVSVNSNEEEAEVLVDGSFVGNAPAKLKLAEGTHVIEVKKDGYKPFKKEIKVTEGSELNLRAVLQKQ